jgi:plasmid stabilization system protein ParE
MVFKITWSPLAIRTFEDNLKYLEKEWSENEVDNFKNAINSKLNVLSKFPFTGYPSIQNRYLRKTLIGKRIILLYRFKPSQNEIELVRFFNSWQNPRRLKK